MSENRNSYSLGEIREEVADATYECNYYRPHQNMDGLTPMDYTAECWRRWSQIGCYVSFEDDWFDFMIVGEVVELGMWLSGSGGKLTLARLF